MKEIKLTNSHLVSLVDDEDFEIINQYNWRLNGTTIRKGYAVRGKVINGVPTGLSIHREVLGLLPNDGKIVDHINNNKLDNRKENLRIASAGQNRSNATKNKNNKSGFKNVSWVEKRGYYKIQVRKNGIDYNKYGFKTLREAIIAANELILLHHGEFAKLNEIPD